MYQGDNSGIFPGLNQYSMPGGTFAQHTEGGVDNVVAAIIVTPSKTGKPIDWTKTQVEIEPFTQWRYPAQIERIRTSLEHTYHIEPIVALYPVPDLTPREKREKLAQTGLGKVIVKYTPKLPTYIDSNGRCSRQYAGFDVWVYGNLLNGANRAFHGDRWPAYRDQQIPLWSRDDGNEPEPDACDASSQIPASTSTASTSISITPASTTPTTTRAPEITSCSLASFTYSASNTISTYTNCVCNDNQSGWPHTQTATDGVKKVVCFKEGDPIVPMTTIPPPVTRTRPAAPDITSCWLKEYTVTYSSTVDGTVASSPSQINVCTCNGHQESTPFTETALDKYETVLCNKTPGGPTIVASVVPPGPTCSISATHNVPFRSGICTLNMTQKVSYGDINQAWLVYSAWDGSDIPADACRRDREIDLDMNVKTVLTRCETGFPFTIEILLNVKPQGPDRKLLGSTNSSHSNSSHARRSNDDYGTWGIDMKAGGPSGMISWQELPGADGPFDLPYCNVGKWDNGNNHQRSIDCHWEC